MKTLILLATLGVVQVLCKEAPVDPSDPYRAPDRPSPEDIDEKCTRISNCDKCYDPSLQCNDCNHRYYKTDSWLQCIACSAHCDTCTDKNDDDKTECTKCDPKYYLTKEETCDDCVGHCWTCTEDNQCTTCDPMYHLIATDKVRECIGCTDFCLECADTGLNSCRECMDGYYLNNLGGCTKCPLGCNICKDGTSCTTCETGKGWDSASVTCKSCIANCMACKTSTDCTQCNSGYSLSGDKTKCYVCPNCKTCSSAGDCTECNYGYILQDSMCWTCPNIATGSVCDAGCGKPDNTMGRYLDGAECLYCPANAKACTAATTITTCVDGTYNTGTACAACDSSCLTCSGALSTNCLTCTTGKYLNTGTNACADCSAAIAGCAECPDDGATCTKCNSGKYRNSDDTECLTCSDDDETGKACQDCGSTPTQGKAMDSTQGCLGACVTGCIKCTDATSCDVCEKGKKWVSGGCTGTGDTEAYYSSTSGDTPIRCSLAKLWDTAASPPACNDGPASFAIYNVADTTIIDYCEEVLPVTADGVIVDCTGGMVNDHAWHKPDGTKICMDGFTMVASTCTDCSAYTPLQLTKSNCNICKAGDTGTVGMFWNGVCTDCPAGCLECTIAAGVATCSQCDTNKYWDDTAKECRDVNCDAPDHTDECAACAEDTRGRQWSDPTCHVCPENCLTCTTDQDCTECVTGMDWNNSEKKCVDCFFDDSTQCTTCGTSTYGRFFDDSNSQCLDCPIGCKYCVSTTECTDCFSGYYMEGNTKLCQSCPSTPSAEDVCNTCKGASWYWDSDASSCNQCPNHCTSCSAANSCDTCSGGYYWDATNLECKTCASSCSSCSTGTSCSQCDANKYFDSASNKCITCPTNCVNCQTDGGCKECIVDHYLEDNTCHACNSAITGCVDCNSKSSCRSCGSRKYLKAGNTECADCIEGCLACSDATTCDTCEAGRCWDETASVCRVTSINCDTCHLINDELTCDTCINEHALEICTACTKQFCIKCDGDKDICEECAAGYYVEGDGCTVCPSGSLCVSCSGPEECKKCISGYFWDTTASACTSCPSGCSTCTNTDSCKCDRDNWFFDKEKKRCSACMSGCESCSDPGDKCTKCYSNYTPVTAEGSNTITACTACPTGCAKCHQGTDETLVCDECMEGYYMIEDGNGGTCQLCSTDFPDCISCKDDKEKDGVIRTGECSACAGGVLKDDESECLRCSNINGCDECVDLPSLCMQCADTYHPTLDLQSCNLGCYQCDSSESESCVDNVASNNTIIESCPGLGETASCYSKMTKLSDGNIITRYCNRNSTCPEPNSESCQQGNTDEECVVCCKDNTCNTVVLQGQTASGTISHHTAGFMISALMMLLCHVILNA